MDQLLSPRSDVVAVGEVVVVLLVWGALVWRFRRRPDVRLLTVGAGLVVLALIGLRAAH